MIHDPIAPPVEWHSVDCQCPTCEPYVPSQPFTLGTGRIAVAILLGLLHGLLIAFLVDAGTHGPGLAVMVGRS